ncbi:uncharacterized protein LOC144554849 [Carex rostrata]
MGTRQLESFVRERCRSGTLTVPEARCLFDRLLATSSPTPSIYPFNHLFTALVRMNNLTNHYPTIFSLFNRLTQNKHISPDVCTYGILINCCTRVDRVGLAFVLLGQFLKVGPGVHSDVFNPLLKGLCKHNRIHEAAAIVLDKMPMLGCTPDLFSYNTLINGHCKKGDIEKAEELLDDMVSRGLQPDVVTYNTLIDGLCKKGLIDKALNMLQHIVSEGHEPDVMTYTALMDALCKNGEIDKAKDVLHHMIAKGYVPNVVTYNMFMDALCKEGQPELAEELLHHMISGGLQPNVVNYSTLIDGFCKMDKLEKAKKLLSEMVSKGYYRTL